MSNNSVSIGVAAKMLGVCTDSVRKYTDSGRLSCCKTIGGHRRFVASEIERFAKEHDCAYMPPEERQADSKHLLSSKGVVMEIVKVVTDDNGEERLTRQSVVVTVAIDSEGNISVSPEQIEGDEQ